MLGERTRRSSCFVEVAGPEARQLDKLAWSRRCAMLMESACPWKLEHVCWTFLERSRCLDNITESLDHQSDRLCAYHLSRLQKLEEGSLTCHDLLQPPYRNRELRPITGRLGFGRASPKSWGLPVESHLQWCEMIDPTPICPRRASRRCLGLACDRVASECLFGDNLRLWGLTRRRLEVHISRKWGSRLLAQVPKLGMALRASTSYSLSLLLEHQRS